MLALTNSARRPRSRMAWAVASAGSRLRKKLTTMSAPRCARLSAIARPMPRPEPVISAILFSNSCSLSSMQSSYPGGFRIGSNGRIGWCRPRSTAASPRSPRRTTSTCSASTCARMASTGNPWHSAGKPASQCWARARACSAPAVTSAFHVMPCDGQLQDTVIELAHGAGFCAPRVFERLRAHRRTRHG